jgi:hypothetical protein
VAAVLKSGERFLLQQTRKLRAANPSLPEFKDLPVEVRFTLMRLAFNGGPGHAKKLLVHVLNGGDIQRSGSTARDTNNVERTAVLHATRAIRVGQKVFGKSPNEYRRPGDDLMGPSF